MTLSSKPIGYDEDMARVSFCRALDTALAAAGRGENKEVSWIHLELLYRYFQAFGYDAWNQHEGALKKAISESAAKHYPQAPPSWIHEESKELLPRFAKKSTDGPEGGRFVLFVDFLSDIRKNLA